MTATASPVTENGFTLVEMMVAMTIFALLAAAGVGLLRSSVDTQAAVQVRLSETSRIGRLHALLSNDLTHALVRPSVTQSVRPAFTGGSGTMTFSRSGLVLARGEGRSELQQVEWRSDGRALLRTGGTGSGGVEAGEAARLIGDVQQARFRYRAPTGAWGDSFQSSAEAALPSAVELTLAANGRPPLTIVVAVPSAGLDGLPIKPRPPAGASV